MNNPQSNHQRLTPRVAKLTAQQGDVLLKRIDSLPEGQAQVISRSKLVLAEGETTGHFHGLEETDSELIRIGDQIILNLHKQATLTHQEHNPITLEPGLWSVTGVREYDYFTQMARRVQD